jgi:hypothetical protein
MPDIAEDPGHAEFYHDQANHLIKEAKRLDNLVPSKDKSKSSWDKDRGTYHVHQDKPKGDPSPFLPKDK